jgi:hypothetical protein
MRIFVLLALLVLAGCAGGSPAPCNPPMVVDQTGECVSAERAIHRR